MANERPRLPAFLFPLIAIILLVSGCESSTTTLGVTYEPPFAPVMFIIDSSGAISVQGDLAIETPIGSFGLEETISDKLQPEDGTLLLIIRHKQNGRIVDDAYKIQIGKDEVRVVTNGTTTIDVTQHKVFIDASNGSIQSIEVKDDNAGGTSPSSSQISTPIPTPVPPTPTPIPPKLCTDQNGAPPNGPETTELMINCMLPSGSAALIVVCNEAHLSQPFDVQVQGPGIISYQKPAAGSSSLSIEAQNTALANASCPAKFLVVSLTQVDGQVTQEVQRLKNLIGNNAGVTYRKVVGENVTRTYY